MMVIADRARNLPGPVLVLPQMNELSFPYAFSIFMSRMMEPVHPGLQHAVTLHIKNLQRSRDQLSRGLPANVLFDAVRQSRLPLSDPALIMIKLTSFIKKEANFSRSHLL